jgi:hypothetical protein
VNTQRASELRWRNSLHDMCGVAALGCGCFVDMKDALHSSAGVPPAFTLTTNRTSGTTVEALGFTGC